MARVGRRDCSQKDRKVVYHKMPGQMIKTMQADYWVCRHHCLYCKTEKLMSFCSEIFSSDIPIILTFFMCTKRSEVFLVSCWLNQVLWNYETHIFLLFREWNQGFLESWLPRCTFACISHKLLTTFADLNLLFQTSGPYFPFISRFWNQAFFIFWHFLL